MTENALLDLAALAQSYSENEGQPEVWVVVCTYPGGATVNGPYTRVDMDGPTSNPCHPLHLCTSGDDCEGDHSDVRLVRPVTAETGQA